MTQESQLSIRDMYAEINHTDQHGISGYEVEKKYFDPLKAIEDRENLKKKKGQKDRRHVIKRGNFLDDEANLHKAVPGPGKYPFTDQWPEKAKLKIKYADRKTYIQEIMKEEKRQKRPAPCAYNVVKTMKQIQAEKKRLASRKIKAIDRTTYLDGIQYQSTQVPGVGNYNPRQRVHTEGSKIKTKPEDWRKKHELMDKKKPPKAPQPTTYKPRSATYTVFDDLLKTTKSNKNYLGKVQRFKTDPSGSGLNPSKYNVIQEWRGKEKKEVGRHGIEVLSTKSTHKSVYYH